MSNEYTAAEPISHTATDAPGKPGAVGTYFSSWASWAGEKKKALAGAKGPEVPSSPDPDGASARSSLFSRWSRSSQDLTPRPQAKEEDTRNSGETTRAGSEAAQRREKKLPAIRKSLPPPPLPAKDRVGAEAELPIAQELEKQEKEEVVPVEKSVEPKQISVGKAPKPAEAPEPDQEKPESVEEKPIRRSAIEPTQPCAIASEAAEELQALVQKTPEMKPAQLEEKLSMQPLSPGVTIRRPISTDRRPLSPERPVQRSPSPEKPTRSPPSSERSARTPVSPNRLVRRPLSIDRTPQEKPIEHRPLRRPTGGFAARNAAAAAAAVPEVQRSPPKPEPSPAAKCDDAPKVNSIVKRSSLKLGAETAADPRPSPPVSPTKRAIPSAAASAKPSTIAARRAMFENR